MSKKGNTRIKKNDKPKEEPVELNTNAPPAPDNVYGKEVEPTAIEIPLDHQDDGLFLTWQMQETFPLTVFGDDFNDWNNRISQRIRESLIGFTKQVYILNIHPYSADNFSDDDTDQENPFTVFITAKFDVLVPKKNNSVPMQVEVRTIKVLSDDGQLYCYNKYVHCVIHFSELQKLGYVAPEQYNKKGSDIVFHNVQSNTTIAIGTVLGIRIKDYVAYDGYTHFIVHESEILGIVPREEHDVELLKTGVIVDI